MSEQKKEETYMDQFLGTCSAGDKFRHTDGDLYILARIEMGEVILINCHTGDRWSESVTVGADCASGLRPINGSDFARICNLHPAAFTLFEKKRRIVSKPKRTFSSGDRFRCLGGIYKGHTYILAGAGSSGLGLIDLKSGEWWSGPARVDDVCAVTMSEFSKITNSIAEAEFVRIEKP